MNTILLMSMASAQGIEAPGTYPTTGSFVIGLVLLFIGLIAVFAMKHSIRNHDRYNDHLTSRHFEKKVGGKVKGKGNGHR